MIHIRNNRIADYLYSEYSSANIIRIYSFIREPPCIMEIGLDCQWPATHQGGLRELHGCALNEVAS